MESCVERITILLDTCLRLYRHRPLSSRFNSLRATGEGVPNDGSEESHE